jgi:hypothetical protein
MGSFCMTAAFGSVLCVCMWFSKGRERAWVCCFILASLKDVYISVPRLISRLPLSVSLFYCM